MKKETTTPQPDSTKEGLQDNEFNIILSENQSLIAPNSVRNKIIISVNNEPTFILYADNYNSAVEPEKRRLAETIRDSINERQKLLDSNRELVDIGSTILAIMALQKVERFDIEERLKTAILNANK